MWKKLRQTDFFSHLWNYHHLGLWAQQSLEVPVTESLFLRCFVRHLLSWQPKLLSELPLAILLPDPENNVPYTQQGPVVRTSRRIVSGSCSRALGSYSWAFCRHSELGLLLSRGQWSEAELGLSHSVCPLANIRLSKCHLTCFTSKMGTPYKPAKFVERTEWENIHGARIKMPGTDWA
jgi:hypothetical protein